MPNVLWMNVIQFAIIYDLTRQLFHNLLRQLIFTVAWLGKIHKCHEIPFSFFTLHIGHNHVVVVQLLEQFELAITNANHNDADGKSTAFH